ACQQRPAGRDCAPKLSVGSHKIKSFKELDGPNPQSLQVNIRPPAPRSSGFCPALRPSRRPALSLPQVAPQQPPFPCPALSQHKPLPTQNRIRLRQSRRLNPCRPAKKQIHRRQNSPRPPTSHPTLRGAEIRHQPTRLRPRRLRDPPDNRLQLRLRKTVKYKIARNQIILPFLLPRPPRPQIRQHKLHPAGLLTHRLQPLPAHPQHLPACVHTHATRLRINPQ